MKIIVAVDLTEDSLLVLNKAIDFTKSQPADLMLIHVIEPLGYAYGGDIPIDLTDIQAQLNTQAESHLEKLGLKAKISKEQQRILIGRPEHEIHALAKQENADLIVLGSHGRHGLQLLLGSTANAVLHGAPCDVLAVRVQNT